MNVADMRSPSEVLARYWRRQFERWMDGVEAGWAIPVLLIGFVAVWLAFLTIAFFNADLHPDTLQAWSSGRDLAWGYAKNPPLAAWIAHAWALLFPLTNWSFRLLALLHAAFALWTVDLISRRFVWGDKRIVLLLLLMLLPVYQFLAQPFGAETVLLAAWPMATYCFLRSFETRRPGWAVAAGVTAALALLGGYYSAFLILGFMAAAICHSQRRAYFTSTAPPVAMLAALAVLGPHLYWLATTGSRSFADALGQMASKAAAPSLIETFLFMLILALVLAVPVLIWSRISAQRIRQLARDVSALTPGFLLLLMVGVGIIVFPIVAAVTLGTDMIPALGLQSTFLFAILIVCGGPYPIPRSRTVNLVRLATAIAVLCVVAVAPLHAIYRNYNPFDNGRNSYQSSAVEMTRQWHAQSDQPLPAVGGDRRLALAAAFYSPDHPPVDEQLVPPHAQELQPEATIEHGWAALCGVGDARCLGAMESLAAKAEGSVRSEFMVESKLPELAAIEQRFVAFIVPPSPAAPAAAAPAIAAAPTVTAPAAANQDAEVAALSSAAASPATADPAFPPLSAPAAVTAEDDKFGPPPSAESASELTTGAAHQAAQTAAPPAACCVPGLTADGAAPTPEVNQPEVAPARAKDKRSIRSMAAMASGPNRAAAAGCSVRTANGRRCGSAARVSAVRVGTAIAHRDAAAAGPLGSMCSSDNGDPGMRRPVLAQLAQPLCALAGALGARPKVSQGTIPASTPAGRAKASAAELQLLRGEPRGQVMETAEDVGAERARSKAGSAADRRPEAARI